jgi:hypothetical protein
MTVIQNIPASGRSNTKKALFIGISCHKREGRSNRIPTSIPGAKKFATFLSGERSLAPSTPSCILEHCGYIGYRFNDRLGGSRRKISTNRGHFGSPLAFALDPRPLTIPSIRNAKLGPSFSWRCQEIAVSSTVRAIPSRHSLSPTLILPPTLNRRSFRPAALHNG